MATIPVIDLLPDPPLPTDAEPVFDAKAGASLTAQQKMVPQINASVAFINQTAVDASTAIEASATAVAAKNDAQSAAAQAKASATAAEGAQGSLGNLALLYATAISM